MNASYEAPWAALLEAMDDPEVAVADYADALDEMIEELRTRREGCLEVLADAGFKE